MNEENNRAGWGKSPSSRKWHYFPADDMFSLCRGIGFYFGPREQGNDGSLDNCAQCKKKLAVINKTLPHQGAEGER